jgi:hypothetical protein
MKSSAVNLHDNTLDVLQALDNNESITLLYRGKIKGVIKPAKTTTRRQIQDHPFFGMYQENTNSVLDELSNLRKPRYDI